MSPRKPKADNLPIEKVRTDGETQPRTAMLETLVAEFVQAMREGDEFPPITVYYDGTNYWLADGFHRLAAWKKMRREFAECEVLQGTQADAQWHAAGANRKHGLRRTNEDKARAVQTALKVHPEQSDSEIARHVGVDHKTVASQRGGVAHLGNSQDAPPAAEPEQKPVRVVKRGGKAFTMDVSKIGKAKRRKAGPITYAKKKFNPPQPFVQFATVLVPMAPDRALSTLIVALGKPFMEAVYLLLKAEFEGDTQ